LDSGIIGSGQLHHFRQRLAARTINQLVLDVIPETIVELVDQGGFVMLDVLAETLELSNVLRDGGGLAKLADFSFGRDNQVGVTVDGCQGVGECVERSKLRGGFSVVLGC
jgi:hypothetical protein